MRFFHITILTICLFRCIGCERYSLTDIHISKKTQTIDVNVSKDNFLEISNTIYELDGIKNGPVKIKEGVTWENFMDEMKVESILGMGTKVYMKK